MPDFRLTNEPLAATRLVDRGHSLLVLNDEPLRLLIGDVLSRRGYRSIEVGGIERLMPAFENGPCALIVVDEHAVAHEGISATLTGILKRAAERTEPVSLVAVVPSIHAAAAAAALALGVDDIVPEPIDPAILDLRLSLLERRRQRARRERVPSPERDTMAMRQLLASTERQAQELTLLQRVRSAIALDVDLSDIFRNVVEQVAAAFGYTHVSLYSLEEDQVLLLQHQVGYDQVLVRIPIDHGVVGRVARSGEALLIEDVKREPEFLAAISDLRSEICVPFFRRGQVAGIVNVESINDRILGTEDLSLIAEVTGYLNLAVERNALHSAVLASEQRLRLALEAADMGTWEWYPATGEVRWSEHMAPIYGLPPGTTKISAGEWHNIVHPDDRDMVLQADRHFLRVGDDYEIEFRIVLPSGAVRWLEGKGRAIERGPDGEVTAAVGVTMDITGRKRLEEERLRLAQTEMERTKARDAQRLITSTLERMTAGFVALDRAWRFTYLNQRALAMLGRQIAVGDQVIWSVFPEIAGTEIEAAFREAARSQTAVYFDSHWPGPDRWFELHIYPAAEGLSIYLQDVTERRRAEEEQRRIEERFRALIQHASDVILIIGRDGRVRYASPSIGRLMGVAPEAIVGRDNLFRVHPQDAKRLRLAFVRVAKRPGVNPPFVLRFQHGDGRYRWMEVTATNLFDDPAIEGIVANCRDVTDRFEAEFNLWFLAETSALLGATLDLETTLSNIGRLVVMNLADMCIVDVVNEQGGPEGFAVAHRDPETESRLERIRAEWPLDPTASYGPSYVLETGKSLLYPTIDDEMQALWIGPSEGGPNLAELELRSAIIVPMVVRGAIVGVLTIASETPDRFSVVEQGLVEELGRRAALAIDNALLYRAARGAIEARDQFLSVAAHELRTPITAITGFATLLDRELDNRKDPLRLNRFVRRLMDASTRLTVLVDDLLDVSRIRAGNLPLRIMPVDLEALVERVHRRYEDQDTGLLSLITLQKPEGSCVIPGDEDRLDQVITNVIDNAIKYSPEGGEIMVGLRGDGDGVLLQVKDQGIGLAVEDTESIFKPFGRAANAVEGNIPGLGIGLYICRNITERHGGRIWAESDGVGKGTSVFVWLPTKLPDENIAPFA